jgi:DNA-binding CsgD family transcriptional regulator
LLQHNSYGFAARAARGIAAAASAYSHSHDLLTFQEREVATRAAAGHTNAEIALSLFLSRHTIDYHLRKVFQKLGISSRRELNDALSGQWNPEPSGCS